jgi:hypothetical protein
MILPLSSSQSLPKRETAECPPRLLEEGQTPRWDPLPTLSTQWCGYILTPRPSPGVIRPKLRIDRDRIATTPPPLSLTPNFQTTLFTARAQNNNLWKPGTICGVVEAGADVAHIELASLAAIPFSDYKPRFRQHCARFSSYNTR